VKSAKIQGFTQSTAADSIFRGSFMSNAEQPVQQDENQLIAERRAKLAEWRKTGKAFPNDFQRENTAFKLLEGYDDKTSEELLGMPVEVRVAGP